MEKEDWYFVIGVLMWLIERIEHHIENKEKRKEKKKKTPKNQKTQVIEGLGSGTVGAVPLLKLYIRNGGIAMDWLKKHRRDIIELVIMGGLLLFTNWDKEAFKALIAGGIIGAWITKKM